MLACWCLSFSVLWADNSADKIKLENERLQQQQQIEQEKIDYYNNLNSEEGRNKASSQPSRESTYSIKDES